MTLLEIVTMSRGKLDDEVGPRYGWSDIFLTGCVNETINELCSKIPMVIDATTAAVCQLAFLAGAHTATISERITGIQRAELASTSRPLDIVVDVDEMDSLVPGWKLTVASVPSKIIKDGLGNNLVRVWPPTLLADTVNLTVSRLPLNDLVWANDQAVQLGIPVQYHDQIYEGIMYRAYEKNDTDSDNKRKADEHHKAWDRKVEEIRRAHIYKTVVPHTAAPSAAWM